MRRYKRLVWCISDLQRFLVCYPLVLRLSLLSAGKICFHFVNVSFYLSCYIDIFLYGILVCLSLPHLLYLVQCCTTSTSLSVPLSILYPSVQLTLPHSYRISFRLVSHSLLFPLIHVSYCPEIAFIVYIR